MLRGFRRAACAAPLLFLAACGQAPLPVGSLAATPAEIELPGSGFTTVSLAWEMGEPLAGAQGKLRVFVHLLGADGEVLRTFDHDFPGEWQVGEEKAYDVVLFQSALGPALENGKYALTAGLYDENRKRWPVRTGDETAGEESRVATVTAAGAGPGFPEFYFSESWMPIEGGTDRQILGRRWLSGNGALRLARIRQPGTIWLRIGIPSGEGEMQELVLQPGHDTPTAEIGSECLQSPVRIAGSGSHTARLEIDPGDPAGEEEAETEGACEIRFTSNFELLSRDSRERRSIALETIAWAGR